VAGGTPGRQPATGGGRAGGGHRAVGEEVRERADDVGPQLRAQCRAGGPRSCRAPAAPRWWRTKPGPSAGVGQVHERLPARNPRRRRARCVRLEREVGRRPVGALVLRGLGSASSARWTSWCSTSRPTSSTSRACAGWLTGNAADRPLWAVGGVPVQFADRSSPVRCRASSCRCSRCRRRRRRAPAAATCRWRARRTGWRCRWC